MRIQKLINDFKNKINNLFFLKPQNKLNYSNSDSLILDPSNEDIITINIIHTNDMHGKYYPNNDSTGGMPYIASIIKKLKNQYPDSLLIDIGDTVYNPPYDKQHHFKPMIKIMNTLKYDLAATGNHEYQYGVNTLINEYVKQANFKVLNSNILDKSTNKLPDGILPYVILNKNGINIAFISVCTTELATDANPQVGKDTIKIPITEILKELIPKVKAQSNIVILLAHEGINKIEQILTNNPDIASNIDVVFAGHDHNYTPDPIIIKTNLKGFEHKTYIVEMGAYTKHLGFSQIKYDKKQNKIIDFILKPFEINSKTIQPDPEIKQIIEQYFNNQKENINILNPLLNPSSNLLSVP
jgi:2',3'-cyclic-nucleotide 2'-phosphodiesterase (5'-nucleotidase family)